MEWRLAGLMECLQGKLHNTGSITREGEEEGEEGERERRERGRGEEEGEEGERKRRERRRERGRGEEEEDNILHTIIRITHKAKYHKYTGMRVHLSLPNTYTLTYRACCLGSSQRHLTSYTWDHLIDIKPRPIAGLKNVVIPCFNDQFL